MNRVTTAFLLTCAAIGVAGGVLLWGAGWASTVLFATVPFASAALAGLWLLPATVALRLLERPLAGILVGVLSGLVVFPFIGAAIWWAFFAELAFIVALPVALVVVPMVRTVLWRLTRPVDIPSAGVKIPVTGQ